MVEGMIEWALLVSPQRLRHGDTPPYVSANPILGALCSNTPFSCIARNVYYTQHHIQCIWYSSIFTFNYQIYKMEKVLDLLKMGKVDEAMPLITSGNIKLYDILKLYCDSNQCPDSPEFVDRLKFEWGSVKYSTWRSIVTGKTNAVRAIVR
jgi:hypothetical protein